MDAIRGGVENGVRCAAWSEPSQFSMFYRTLLLYALAAIVAFSAWDVRAQADVAMETTLMADPAEEAAPAAKVDRWWVLFTGPVACDLGLSKDALQRLREMDARHYEAYWALGDEPSRHPDYVELSRQRTAEVKALLTPDQFSQWSARYDPLRPR
jgi:hypothetical protein